MLKVLRADIFPSLDICDIETWGFWNVIPVAFDFFLHVNCTVGVKLQVILGLPSSEVMLNCEDS